jgi:acetyl esterase/lipase
MAHPMRRTFAAIAAALSALMGYLIVAPSLSYQNSIWIIQMLLAEASWIPAVFGVFAVALSAKRPRAWWALLLGGFGMLLGLQPYWQTRKTIMYNKASMRANLGAEFERDIPYLMRKRIAQSRWSLPNMFGARTRITGIDVENDVPFAQTPQRTLSLDIYRPRIAPAVGNRYPAVIVIHGGSWRFDDKGGVFIPHHRYLASQGYVVFDIQYRLSDEAAYPAAVEDVQTAIQWVREYAPAHNIDADKIALLGRSAGGHLALLAAYQSPVAEQLAAVVAIYPPTDMRMWYLDEKSDIVNFLGGLQHQVPQNFRASSPTEYVRDGLPPTLLVHGYRDDLVLPSHSELLMSKLQATNTPIVALRPLWSRHGFDALTSGLGSQIIQYDIDRYLAWALYRKKTS